VLSWLQRRSRVLLLALACLVFFGAVGCQPLYHQQAGASSAAAVAGHKVEARLTSSAWYGLIDSCICNKSLAVTHRFEQVHVTHF
jgi:hypothetical protein